MEHDECDWLLSYHDKVEEVRKKSTVRLGNLAVWVTILVLASVKSPFQSCSYWWHTSLVEERNLPKGFDEVKDRNCHDLSIEGDSSRSNRWSGKARPGSLQSVTYSAIAKTIAVQRTLQKSNQYSGNFLLFCAENIKFLFWIKTEGLGLNWYWTLKKKTKQTNKPTQLLL